ncbi:white collar 2 type of transcription factor [Cytospora paraplurivora]|uniref:White collar 2 type of transcription factor n=1 Tax=Cytospora paraplurivora TaxID=2898453 RepID=A0AAN9U2Q1_9PEZI
MQDVGSLARVIDQLIRFAQGSRSSANRQCRDQYLQERLLPPEKEVTPTPSPPPRPLVATEFARQQDAISNVAQWVEETSSSQPREEHQFWLSDPKIVESLFTIHRSAKHLLDFTSTLIGSSSHDTSLGQRPIPVMSNGDVLFMTQLSNDISRSAAGISAVRHHTSRQAARKRARPTEVTGSSSHRGDGDERDHNRGHGHGHGGSVKRVHARHTSGAGTLLSPGAGAAPRPGVGAGAGAGAHWGTGEPACWKCGRTETPEWRKGPDGGVLCNVCGLLYARQRKKMRSTQGGSHASRSLHRA